MGIKEKLAKVWQQKDEVGRREKMRRDNKIELRPENVEGWRKFVGDCREEKIFHRSALKLIPELAKQAEEKGLYDQAAEFYNEGVLIWDQWYRAFQQKIPDVPGKERVLKFVGQKVDQYLKKAEKIVEKYPDSPGMMDVAAREGMFRVKMLLIEEKYEEAENVARETIEKIEKSGHPENAIELYGYQAEALIRSGQVEAGVKLGLETYSRYITDEKVKAKDHNTWVSWRAGCILKTVDALLDTETFKEISPENREIITICLRQAHRQGTAEGIEKFGIRKGQLEHTWGRLRQQGFVKGEI